MKSKVRKRETVGLKKKVVVVVMRKRKRSESAKSHNWKRKGVVVL